MEPFIRLIKPKTLSIFTKKACPHCEKAMGLLDRIQTPYHEHEVSKFKQDEMRHLDEISGIKTVPKVFVGMKCIGGNEELQQSWKKRVLYDWLKKEQISFKETPEHMDMAAGKDAGKDAKMKDKKTEGKKKKNKEDTTTTSSADDAQHKDTSKKKNDSQLGNREHSGNHPEPAGMKKKKNKEDTTTTSSADDAGHKTTSKKKNASQLGNHGENVGGIESAHKGASGTKDEGPLSHLGVKHFESPNSGHKTTKEHAEDALGASIKPEGRLGTRQTDQPKKGMGLDTGDKRSKSAGKAKTDKNTKDHFSAANTVKEAPPLSTQKGGSGTYNPAERRDDSHVDHPLGLKPGASPDDQTHVGEKHPNKVGTHKGDMQQPTNQTGKGDGNRKVVGNHGVTIGQNKSHDHRVNHSLSQESGQKVE